MRVKPDRTLRGRVAGRLVHSLWGSLQQFLQEHHPDENWSVAQDEKRPVDVDIEGDAWEIFSLSVSENGEVNTLAFIQEGLDKIGMSTATAQAAIDKAMSLANRRQ